MPIYEYICLSCNERFALLQKMSASEKEASCPRCSSAKVRKLVSSFCCSSSDGGFSPSSGGFGGGG